MKSHHCSALAAALAAILLAAPSAAQVRLTEFMYEGQGDTATGNAGRRQREFFELTNLGTAAVNVSTWSYYDNDSSATFAFGPTLGSIAAGESIVFTQMTAADFRTYWSLPNSVRIVSYGALSDLGNADAIAVFNSFTPSLMTVVDTLPYFFEDSRASGVSLNLPFGAGYSSFESWISSSAGDIYGSNFAPSPTGFPPNFPQPTAGFDQANYIDLANPGRYAPVPEPSTLALAGIAALALRRRSRRSTCVA
jgi:hypothetical protein